MCKEISFYPIHDLNHFIPPQMMTGLLIPVIPNLKQLIFYINVLRWVQDKLTPWWIYGCQLYLSQIPIIPNARCRHSQVWNICMMLSTILHWLVWNGQSFLSSIQEISRCQTDPHGWTNCSMFGFMLANPDFKESFDYTPYQEFQVDNDERQYKDFMSGDWVWLHTVS